MLGNDPPDSISGEEYLGWLSKYQLLRKDFALRGIFGLV